MLALTQSLLDVSRIEAFHGKIELQPINCKEMIETISAEFENAAQQKRISIELDLTVDDKSTVYSKSDWLPVCINNVISNAVKYTPLGGKVIISSQFNADRFEIHIQDNGPGISKDEQALLFTKFARLSARPTANETSTGLGLYLVKKMCERLLVDIRVHSELGEGTTFILSCPTTPPPHHAS